MFRKNIFFIFILFFPFNGYTQENLYKHSFVSPGLSFGYTFGAGINYGFVLDVGIINNPNPNSLKYGISFAYYFVRTNKYVHRLRSVNAMIQNNFLDVKVGFGRAKNKWGYTGGGGKGNRCIVHGFNFDVSAAYPNIYSPWIGYRTFRYNNFNWAWFTKPYNSVYVKYKYDIIQNTLLSKPETYQN